MKNPRVTRRPVTCWHRPSASLPAHTPPRVHSPQSNWHVVAEAGGRRWVLTSAATRAAAEAAARLFAAGGIEASITVERDGQ